MAEGKSDHIAIAGHGRGRCRARLAQFERSAFAHALGRHQQHAGLALAPRAAFQFGHPFAELVPAVIEQGKQVVADGARLGQPGIHDAFDGAGRFGKLRQADHAAAAFQSMERAAQHGQVVATGGLLARQGQGGVDEGQHFARFGDENVEHFRVDIGHHRRGIHAGWRGGRQGLVEQGHRHGAGGGDFFKWQRAESTGGRIEMETPAGRLRVAAQHIDKKAQRADILRDLVERLGAPASALASAPASCRTAASTCSTAARASSCPSPASCCCNCSSTGATPSRAPACACAAPAASA